MPKDNFNLPEYFALHAYLSALLCGAFVLLPRSTPWLMGSTVQSSSSDRPEYAFLTPITSRPLATMLWDIAGMLLCMSWWGSIMRRWSQTSTKSTATGEAEIAERIGRDSECALATVGGSCLFYVLILGLGAPLDSYHVHSALLALHISVLTVWPVVHALGFPSIYESGTPDSPLERALVYPVIGSLLGAWLGVIPIPLDWDRPWQSYPLTPAVSSILGFIAGGFVSWLHSALLDTFDEVQEKQQPSPAADAASRRKRKAKRT
ncbi:uncharacterized protein I206_106639 [Kwoniella pini CBS 10737]|uniref:Phosphatidylinositol glycan, class F n=1 Tax=Kwoniella pini CBS 10737 TaxID=1296096 RepID=A0AAJ8LAN0_9TREE